jgi:hypothetical protein
MVVLPDVMAATYTFSDWQDFKGAITGDDLTPQPGDIFILSSATYSNKGTATLEDINGTAEACIVIKADTIGGVIFDQALAFDLRHCSYITLQGFNFQLTTKSSVLKLQACNHIRITQNTFDGATETVFEDDGDREDVDWISIQGHFDDDSTLSYNNKVDHNVFKNKMTLGNIIKIDGTADLYVSQHDTIEYNYFNNVGPRADNEMETIRVGYSGMSESDGYCVISHNLFEECDGDPEVISVKCNKNTISHNTFRRCAGTLCLRHGCGTLVDGNFFLGEGYTDVAVDSFPASGDNGSGGIRVYGSDHVIINNYFEGLTGTRWDAPITLTQGDAEEGGGLTDHWRIERAVIANNTLINNEHGIEIGYDKSGDYDKPARDVVIAYNILQSDTGSLVTIMNTPDNMTWIDNIVYATGDAVIGDGDAFTDFSSSEAISIDPAMIYDISYYRASVSTPTFASYSTDLGTSITYDLDGELRTTAFNYGADEYYVDSNPIYTPLTVADVGTSEGEYIYLSTSVLGAVRAGQTTTIGVSSDLDWSVSNTDAWVTVESSAGSGDGSFSLVIAENASNELRSTTVTVSSTNHSEDVVSETIVVTQAAEDAAELSLAVSALSFFAAAKDTSIALSSNMDWTAVSSDEWLTVSPSNGNGDAILIIAVTENTSVAERSGTIMVSIEGSLSLEIAVSQPGVYGDEVKLDIISAVASTEQNEDGKTNIASNTLDGDYDTRWSGEGIGAYVDLILDAARQVSYIKVGHYKGDERTSSFHILAWNSETALFDTLMSNVTSEISSESITSYDFDDVTTDLIRFVGLGYSDGAGVWNSYTEFEIWGYINEISSIEFQKKSVVKLYPNPSSDLIFIDGVEDCIAEIYNLQGICLLKQKCNGRIDINVLSLGDYVVRIIDDKGGVAIGSFVKK